MDQKKRIMTKKTRKLGKYEVGRTIGEGSFAKVKFARNTDTGENVAIKIMAKSTILKNKMADQIKREISIMKIVRHPNIVRLYEVLASPSKIYIVLEFVTGGELFDRIVHKGRLEESEARKYFQQLIDAIAHCHCKGISAAEFSCPQWFSADVKSLIQRILDPNPNTRIQIQGIRKHSWFRINYMPTRAKEEEEVNLDDVRAVFDGIEGSYVAENIERRYEGPLMMNAFEMITLSQGLNLSALFDRRQDFVKRQTRFVSRREPSVIIANIEAVATSMGFRAHTRNFKTRLEGLSSIKAGQFAVVIEVVYEVAPSLFMVDVRKAAGETLEYHKFYKKLCEKLENIIWRATEGMPKPELFRTITF
ncbi:hypothetical protein HID58_015042 [Brassica napus]|uniref:non-specific serine/threonine protein kinase n=1 Tax=Brassica napus TaxID=3708 RepID=A0ABQ8DIU8_BRANA|nr:hypothetical protein HID58_015042 [Brassica napus]